MSKDLIQRIDRSEAHWKASWIIGWTIHQQNWDNKKNQTLKLALVSKKISKIIHKHKYQKPNIELPLDNIGQITKTEEQKKTLFSTHIFANLSGC